MTDASHQGQTGPAGQPAADALWSAIERLRALEEAAPVGIIAVDRTGRVVIWNRAAERLLGWSAAEVVGRPLPMAIDETPESPGLLHSHLLQAEAPSGLEARCRHRNGTTITVQLSSAPIRDAEDRVSGTMIVLADITDFKRLKQQFLQSQKMEAIGQLAGGIAHDFNNLLTAIISHAELLLDRAKEADTMADLRAIRTLGYQAAQLTQQLLGFSRKQLLVPRVLDLNQVVDNFSQMLGRIIGEDIRLETVADPSLGRTRADPSHVEQILMNLIVNARDAMPQGGRLTIATANAALDAEFARWHPGLVPGRYVSLIVRDTGCGMPPDIAARVFEPFFTTKSPGKGTGLGLSTVYGLVKQHDGYITIDSVPGAGTTVTIYLPRVNDPADVLAPSRRSTDTLHGSETILLVEDDASVRGVIRRVLERYGYQVLEARDTTDALSVHERFRGQIHLLVTDVVMPNLSGPALAEQILARRSALRVLFVSGYTGPAGRSVIDIRLSSPHIKFLQKPFGPQALLTKVRECLDHDQPQGPD